MDFHGLARRELQALCKKNKIPANQTNVAMADALHALSNVEGIEELSQPEGFQTPALPRTSQRTARKKSELPPDAVVIELEDSAAPVSRATRRGTAARASASRRRVTSEGEGETKEVAGLEALQSPLPTRTAATRRATASKSTRRASEAQHVVDEKESVKPVGAESNIKKSVRRSSRLKSVEQTAEVLLPSAVTKSRRKKMAAKIGALNEEPEECTESTAELVVDTIETVDFTNVEGALESEHKTGLFPASNDSTVEATKEMVLSEENQSEIVDEKELTGGEFKSEPLLPAEVMLPAKESKLDVVDGTNTALLDKETESVAISARRSARIKSVNKAVEECPSITKSRSKKMVVKIGALTEEQEDFTENMPGKMVITVDTVDYTNVEVPFGSVDKTGSYSGSKDLQNAGGEDDSNSAVEAAEEVALSEDSKSEEADEKEETGDFKREPLPQAEVMLDSSEEIKYDVDNTNIALLEEETKTVNQESFLGDMDEEESHMQLPNASNVLEDSEEIKSDVVDITIALLEETESVNQESFVGDMDEDNPMQLPNAPSLEDGEKAVNKDFFGSIGNFSVDDSASSEQTVSNTEPNDMELSGRNELKSLNPTLTDTKIGAYEQIAGLAADVRIKDTNLFVGDVPVEAVGEELEDTNLFVGDVPVEAVGEELAVNTNNIEWSFFMGGCGDSAILSPDATPSVLTAKEHDILASNRVSESPFLLNILYEEEPSEKESEKILIVGTGKTSKKENLNANSVSETPILFDTAETEAMLVVGTEKESEKILIVGTGKTPKKENLNANSVSETPIQFDTAETEAMLVVGTEKKTPGKESVSATPSLCNTVTEEMLLVGIEKTADTPGKSNGKKKTPGKESVKKNLRANSVSATPNLFNTVTEEMLLVGTEKKTPKKAGATPGKSNGKKKTQEDADKENNGAQSLKRESVKKPLQLVVEKRVKEKSAMYQELSLRQLKVLYKEKSSGVKKTPALQPLNQNTLLGDGNI